MVLAAVSGGIGQQFSLNGVDYIAVASYLAPDADLIRRLHTLSRCRLSWKYLIRT